MDAPPTFVASRLQALRREAEKYLRQALQEKHERDASHQLALWLFLFHESSDVLVHSELVHPKLEMGNDATVMRSHILRGQGTIGFVLHTSDSEAVADTFDDPRGTVAVQDTLLRNYSWCGVCVHNTEGKPIGIVSFFPVSTELSYVDWPDEVIRDVQSTLRDFVVEHNEQFSLLCHLALARESNRLLTEAFRANPDSPFQSKVAAMLNRILMLGAPFGKLPAVLYLERRTLREARRQGHEYACGMPSFLRFNAARLRLDRLQHLQWTALTKAEESAEGVANFDAEEVATIPLVLRDNHLEPGLLLAVHVRRDGVKAKDVVEKLCKPWQELFKTIYKSYYLESTSDSISLKRRKVRSEAAALLFGEFSRLLLVKEAAVGGDQGMKETERAKLSLLSLEKFLQQESISGLGFEPIVDFLDDFDPLHEDLELLRAQVIGLSLWHRISEWLIERYQFDEPSEVEKLKASGNWRVLQRAAALGDSRPLQQYKPIDWHAVTDWTVSKISTKECTISWPEHSVTFSERDSFFPLDLQLCDEGLAAHFFDQQLGVPTFLSEGQESGSPCYLQYSNANDRLGGRHEILAREGNRIIAAGPWMPPTTTLETDAQITLVEFAKKELHVLLLNEYAIQATKASHKAGITAIMARNASHNLGSHVLARHSLRKIVGTARVDELECEIKDAQLLDRYLQGRMDLLAQISTDWPEWTEPARIVGEVLWGFLAQKILLQEIVASEGIGALEWEKVGKEWLGRSSGRNGGIGLNCLVVPRNAWEGFYPAGLEGRDCLELLHMKSAGDMPGAYRLEMVLRNDPLVAIPGGLTGWHAFYIIVENLIRNAAKHGRSSTVGGLSIVIEVLDDQSNKIHVRDNRWGRPLLRPAYLIRMYDDMSAAPDNLLETINDAFNTSVIDEDDGHLRRANWGLAEMKVAAAYLQRRGLDGLSFLSNTRDTKETERTTGNVAEPLADGAQGHTVIRAVRSPLGTLGYEFFLLRPTRLAVARR